MINNYSSPASFFTFESPMDSYYAKYGLLDALIDDRKAMLVNDSIRSLLFILVSGGVLGVFPVFFAFRSAGRLFSWICLG